MRKGPSAWAALAAVAMMHASGAPAIAAPSRRVDTGYRPTKPRMDTEQAREIAAHNAEVDRRKAEKRLRKLTGSPR